MHRTARVVAVLALLTADAAATPVTVMTMSSAPGHPVALRDPASGRIDVAYTAFNFFGPSMNTLLWLTSSQDNGASWSPASSITPAAAPRIVTMARTSPSLLHTTSGSTALFYEWYAGPNTRLWRAESVDGHAFPSATPIELGWLETRAVRARVVAGPGGELSMLYVHAGEGPRPAGLYFARSVDSGVSWDASRTFVAGESNRTQPALAVRSADGRHVAAYTVDVDIVAGTRSIVVRTTIDADDWSGTPITLTEPADHRQPALSLMPDGAFLLVWARASGAGSDLVARRSTDGLEWSDELTLVEGNGARIGYPFGLVGSSPGAVDLYWTRDTGIDAGVIEHEHVVVLDVVFADGFD